MKSACLFFGQSAGFAPFCDTCQIALRKTSSPDLRVIKISETSSVFSTKFLTSALRPRKGMY